MLIFDLTDVPNVLGHCLRRTAVILTLSIPSTAAAQAGPQFPVNLGSAPVIGGMTVQCYGVPAVVTPINDIAMARPGAIILNPTFFQLPGKLQLFIYAHECAHHVPQIAGNEGMADCWAIKVGRVQSWFVQEDIAYLQQYFGNSPGDWTHAPGPVRVQTMINCFLTP
ncbi:MAG TPA: hypothetical protein VGP25_13770 [Gemmatimonadaceae bacterium]|nr:hypothetical protein [Gemmatimonadaceae bacterium]